MDTDKITESIAYSFFEDAQKNSNPKHDNSYPKYNKKDAYSWVKAPRYNDNVVEVGALARNMVSGDPLTGEFFASYESSTFTRVFARIHEAAKLINAIGRWTNELKPDESYYTKNTLKENAEGIGMIEAARGFLGHWISVKDGKLNSVQVITPTAWNASPMDDKKRHGPIESSLINTKIKDEDKLIEANHIIRSFDPCAVCSVH